MAHSTPLTGCHIAVSGNFRGQSQSSIAAIERDLLLPLGATLTKTVNAETSHLITTEYDFSKQSTKVTDALKQGGRIHIVNLQWLQDCLNQATRLAEDPYSFAAPARASPPAVVDNGNSQPERRTSKRTVVVLDDSAEEEDTTPKPQPKKKTKAVAAASDPILLPSNGPKPVIPDTKTKPRVSDGATNIAKLSYLNIPVDEACPLSNYTVYIDKEGVIYDASLNQANSTENNNKFYRIQLLTNNAEFKTWTRWGRVGNVGQSKVLGNGMLNDALKQYDSKFKDKSGLSWADRGNQPNHKKYVFVERSYTEDTEEEDVVEPTTKSEPVASEVPQSKLSQPVQDLMALIFNKEYFSNTMYEMNYDKDKLPLGKLSKNTIIRGYQALKDLSELLDDPSLAGTKYRSTRNVAVESLSNMYFSLIPHNFGVLNPPIIHTQDMLKREVDLMDSLSDMKDASIIMKKEPEDAEKINALDRQFRGLNLDEMTPLKRESTEFTELKKYLVDTRGSTHNANYQVDQIFRIERRGEGVPTIKGTPGDRRLLWHGSRATNFGGILSQGLRIAPPEAPVNGYMFGKGIYLADMSSKSANYCSSHSSNGHALLLLCEAELGDPMQVLTNANYNAGDDALAKGLSSTWGQGSTGPALWRDAETVHPSLKGIKMPDTTVLPGPTGIPSAYLLYNEYITYSVEQVRLRYLFRVRM